MDFASSSKPGSPSNHGGGGSPLQTISHNQQRHSTSLFSSLHRGGAMSPEQHVEDLRDSSVHDKINQFNTLAMQSKQLERKTADAALKRAMLGREEAEAEMRRYRDECRALRKQVEEGKERERKVGERLETVMENYGRAKETHVHTQQLWEKEIRRSRKETFKVQSNVVKLQEELKSSRIAQKAAEEELERERERSKAREQEAFDARYQLVGLQEQLGEALEKVKILEQERDAFKALAKSHEEEVVRIAAEGKLPLPRSEPESAQHSGQSTPAEEDAPRESIRLANIRFSETAEAEIEELNTILEWERQRADRALELVQFLEAECQLKVCQAGKSSSSRKSYGASRRNKRPSTIQIADGGDLAILSGSDTNSPDLRPSSPKRSKTERLVDKTRRSIGYVTSEGVFRTVSQELHRDITAVPALDAPSAEHQQRSQQSRNSSEPPIPLENMPPRFARTPSVEPPQSFGGMLTSQRTSLLSLLDAPHRREPSPPITFHVPTMPGPGPDGQIPQQQQQQPRHQYLPLQGSGREQTPDEDRHHQPERARRHIPANPAPPAAARGSYLSTSSQSFSDIDDQAIPMQEKLATSAAIATASSAPFHVPPSETPTQFVPPPPRQIHPPPLSAGAPRQSYPEEPQSAPLPQQDAYYSSSQQSDYMLGSHNNHGQGPFNRPQSSTAFYQPLKTVTTTTRVPLKEESSDPSLASRIMKLQRTPSQRSAVSADGDLPSFDPTNPALTPTMTREEALAQIRSRRARSLAKGESANDNRPSGSSAAASGGTSAAPAVTPARRAGGGAPENATGTVRGRERERRNWSAPDSGTGQQGTVRGKSAVRRVRT